MVTQLSSLNLDSFIFQLRQLALESQGVFGYLQMLIFGPETSKLPMKPLSRVFFSSKQEEPKNLSACLNCFYELNLWYPAQTTVFFFVFCFLFSYDVLKLSWLAMWEVIFNLSIFYWEDLGVTFTSKLKRLENVFHSILQTFFNRFTLMSDIKLLQPCACVENFHKNWRIISCPIARLS